MFSRLRGMVREAGGTAILRKCGLQRGSLKAQRRVEPASGAQTVIHFPGGGLE